MDNTPLHPDITTLPPDTGQRHGDFLTAIPYNRSMYRTTLLLRLASMLDAVIILAALAGQKVDDEYYIGNWAFGCPTAAMAWLWSAGDIGAMLVRDRGFRWTKDDPTKLPRSTKFSWGKPGGHVAAHLLIWTPTAAMMAIVISNWLLYQNNGWFGANVDPRQTNTMAAVIFFMFILTMIHFSLFIFAIVEVDNERRHYSDVVFVPRGELCEMVPVPPSTPWELFSPRKLLLSYFANHYVRFVPGADGTVTVARDYSSRQARF
ncbi:hypothetical protein BDP55DRAFT_694273 [Colletotrichum godetiae]|uniref:Uncharacterized protein n=1 Tax=Colletotrichum godetiae TaxID=1209918 RepID=A0AAJ0ANA3_9PEZI|nr:uncharacterized protein BDP55DRAFT_694273 [Colletotrichum godetiae]KAK1674851.1 hypothetical protein BDP55DRAFT_694273 [Colletotrichum godetiae]